MCSYSDAELERMFKFAIVRNPWDRFVSAFSYLKKRGQIPRDEGFEQFAVRGGFDDPHFYEQHPNAYFRGECFVNFVARYETLDEDWPPNCAQNWGE